MGELVELCSDNMIRCVLLRGDFVCLILEIELVDVKG